MTYRVFTGAPGAEAISPVEKDRLLFKEFADFDQALAWAQAVKQKGAVPLLIESDDGTRLTKQDIATALKHREQDVKSGA